MKLIPAIDIRCGRCVHLDSGNFARETVYWDDPQSAALHWQEKGAKLLHVVDLDGAQVGRPVQTKLISAICRAVAVPVQVGGGVRSLDDIAATLEAGAVRVIVGTLALNRDLLTEAVSKYGSQIVVALDTRNDLLATHGWQRTTRHKVTETAAELAAMGVKCFLYSDILRDGTLMGPNLPGIKAVQAAVSLQVGLIASAGVGKIDDLLRLCALGLEGAIIGKALYSGKLDLAECLARVENCSA